MLKYLKDIMSVLLSKKYFIKFSSYEKKKKNIYAQNILMQINTS
jgi:hypothetical protein